jgi:hypothetical protein
MSRQPEERALRYHNYAAFLRRLAGQAQVETARARLHILADQFDQLVRRAFTALGLLPDRSRTLAAQLDRES